MYFGGWPGPPGTDEGDEMRLRMGFAAGLALLALGTAGCGSGDNGDGVASAGGTSTPASAANGASGKGDMAKFAQCMRENGVPDFKDPDTDDNGDLRLELPRGADKTKVDAAMDKCKQYLPNGGQPMKANPEQLAQQRQLAQCMRDNGVSNFPDPDADGRIKINGGSEINPDDPKFKAAQKACEKFAPAGGQAQNKSNG
jgi:hypothetical protein